MIRLFLIGVVILLVLNFVLQNRQEHTTFRYLLGFPEASTPLYVPILIAFGFGMLIGIILLTPTWFRNHVQLRRKTRAVEELEADVERLRRSLEQVSQAPAQAERYLDDRRQDRHHMDVANE